MSVFWVVAHRVGWAAAILWAVALWRHENLPRRPSVWASFLVMGLLNNVVPFTLMAWGQLNIETGLTSILNAATAIFAVLVATMVFADERLTPARAIGVLLGFLGVATAIGLGALFQLDLRSLAQLAVLGGAVSYALAGSWARITLSGLSPVIAAAGMLTASTLMVVPLAWLLEGPPDVSLTIGTWASIGYCSIVATAGAYLLYYRVLAMSGAGKLLLCTLLVSPVAIVLGALFLGETLAPRALVGFAILALGLLVLDGRILRRSNRVESEQASPSESTGRAVR